MVTGRSGQRGRVVIKHAERGRESEHDVATILLLPTAVKTVSEVALTLRIASYLLVSLVGHNLA